MPTSWTIGCLPECDLRVVQPKVSGRHCRLSLDERGYNLEDLNSTNGTYVNGVRVVGPVRVDRTDAITLGLATTMPWPEGGSTARVVRLRIGRDIDNDFVVDAPLVSGRHAQVCWETHTGDFFLEDLGSANGTAIGSPDRKVDRAPLTLGDTVYLGTYPIAAIQLLARLDPSLAPSLPFRNSEAVIGRAEGCDLPLNLPMISSHHARVYRAGDSILIEDLDSANGTFLNGRRIEGSAIIRPGDLVSLGSYTFRLVDDRRPEAAVGDPLLEVPFGLDGSDQEEESNLTGELSGDSLAGWGEAMGHPGLLVGLLVQAPILAIAIVGAMGHWRGRSRVASNARVTGSGPVRAQRLDDLVRPLQWCRVRLP